MNRIIYSPKKGIQPSSAQKMGGRLLFAFIFVFLFLGTGIYAIESPKWHIRNIQMQGAERLNAAEFKNTAAAVIAGNYFLFIPKSFYAFVDTGLIASRLLSAHPEIKSVHAKRIFPDTLDIVLEERTVWGVLCNDLDEKEWLQKEDGVAGNSETSDANKLSEISASPKKEITCAYIDSSGFAFTDAPKSTGPLLLRVRNDYEHVRIPSFGVDSNTMDVIHSLEKEVPRVIHENVVGFEILSRVPSEIRVRTSGGFSLWLLRENNITNTLSFLDALLRKEIKEKRSDLEYVDLRFGNKVFYKMKFN